jgi:uncharacterized protein
MAKELIIAVDSVDEPRKLYQPQLPAALVESFLADLPAWRVGGPARLDVQLTRLSGRDLLLEGRTTLKLESDCRRCLKTVASDVPLSFILNLVAKPVAQGKGKSKRAAEDSGEDAGSASFDDAEADEEPFDGEKVDLEPIAREQVLLGLPSIEPLCGDACKGLCTTCGQDLNGGDCGHSQKAADPRWAALRNIKV